jgi:hypothetical protein
MAHFRPVVTIAASAVHDLGQAANSQRYSLGFAHRRSVARHARTIKQLEFGVRALHSLEQAWGSDAEHDGLAYQHDASLWGGELPVFDSTDATNELISTLIMGLWNRLTRHQDRNSPFRLNRIETASTREVLADLSRMRE